MKDISILMAGFGGQGILFIGKALTYAGLIEGKEVSLVPSYGPEMRGGTVDCTVCISEEPVCSPVPNHPEVLVSMNQLSFGKFIDRVASGGTVIVDSTLVDCATERTDVNILKIPATALADENKLSANVIMLGFIMKHTGCCDIPTIEKALAKCIPPKKQALLPKNMEAVSIGYNF